MCNCNRSTPCNNCNSGIPCNCPPDYSVSSVPVPCTCCPSGYTYSTTLGCSPTVPTGTTRCCPPSTTFNQITGWCGNSGNLNVFFLGFGPTYDTTYCTVPTVPCVTCEESITTDCVVYQCIPPANAASGVCHPCSNVVSGDNLSTIIAKICPTNPANILAMLQVIAADTTYGLKQAFCQISNFCSGIPSSLTPYIGPISFSIP